MRSVKQAIGSGNILPWSRFWKSDCSQYANEESDRYKTPRGGLTLHWIMTVILICGSASIKDLLESISVPGLLQTYAHCFVLGERQKLVHFASTVVLTPTVFVGIGIFWLPGREESLVGTNADPEQRSFFRISHAEGYSKWAVGSLVLIYVLFNLMILVVAPPSAL